MMTTMTNKHGKGKNGWKIYKDDTMTTTVNEYDERKGNWKITHDISE
jgi:hypothetical protein